MSIISAQRVNNRMMQVIGIPQLIYISISLKYLKTKDIILLYSGEGRGVHTPKWIHINGIREFDELNLQVLFVQH